VSVEQIASETGAPVGTVKARLYRGRAALAKQLGPDEADVPVRNRKESGRVG